MSQVTFDLVEFQQPIEDYIDHAQASLITQLEKHARHGIVAAGAALALTNMVIPRVGGNDLQRFSEYRRQAQSLMISFWQDFGLVYLKRAATEEAVVRKVVHVADNGQLAQKAVRGPYKKRSKVAHAEKMRIGELADNPPADTPVEKWFGTIMEDNHIVSMSSVYAHRLYYRRNKGGGR